MYFHSNAIKGMPRIKSNSHGGETLAIKIRNVVMAWIGLKKREGSARDRETVVGRKALNLGNFKWI